MAEEEVFIPKEEPINESGYFYRTQYLVLNRTMMEAMPVDWQKRMVALLDEVGEEFDYESPNWRDEEYSVQAKGPDGRFINNPWGLYKYPNRDYIESVRKKK